MVEEHDLGDRKQLRRKAMRRGRSVAFEPDLHCPANYAAR
jgi:hypothetical protein